MLRTDKKHGFCFLREMLKSHKVLVALQSDKESPPAHKLYM